MKEYQEIYSHFKSNCLEIPLSQIMDDDFRLNSEYYDINQSIDVQKNLEFFPLSNIATVIFPGIFKRILVDSPQNGMGFLTTSEIMMVEPFSDKYLSFELTKNLDIYKVDEGTILVSRSGTIGNTIYVDERLKKFAITEDALRVKPFDEKYLGLIYFYFRSEYGYNIITGKKSGAVIDHIYEEDLLKVPIPKIDDRLISNFYSLFIKIKKNRESANIFMEQARNLVLKYNNLSSLDSTELVSLDPDKQIQIKLTNLSEFTIDYRLDAHFYNPIAQIAIENIKNKASNYDLLESLTSDIIMGKRFKRNYVDSGFGTPFLSGKNIIQIRPTDINYLSNTEISFIDELLIKKNWTLITCSGTLGRTCFVFDNYEDYAASQHILRIIPNESVVDPGYLYSFLSSEYGFNQIVKYRYGAVIDEIDNQNMKEIIVPIPDKIYQTEIGDLVRKAYSLRAEAIKLEDEAQELLQKELISNEEN